MCARVRACVCARACVRVCICVRWFVCLCASVCVGVYVCGCFARVHACACMWVCGRVCVGAISPFGRTASAVLSSSRMLDTTTRTKSQPHARRHTLHVNTSHVACYICGTLHVLPSSRSTIVTKSRSQLKTAAHGGAAAAASPAASQSATAVADRRSSRYCGSSETVRPSVRHSRERIASGS